MSILKHLKALKQRAYAPFFKLGSKAQGELTVVESLLGSMQARGEAKYYEPRSAPSDPPDCIARTANGAQVAIEVTELVCEDAVRINAQRDPEAIRRMEPGVAVVRTWNKRDFITHITEQLKDKDSKKLKGGPFASYVVAIHTDEPLLDHQQSTSWLRDCVFGPFRQISDAYLLFSYMPGRGYEYISLKVAQQGHAGAIHN